MSRQTRLAILAVAAFWVVGGLSQPARADIWPKWMPLPLGFADRDELEKALQEQLLYAVEYKYIDGTVRVIPLGDLSLVFDQELPSEQYIECGDADYLIYGFTNPVGWGTDPVTGTTVPIFCERPLNGEGGADDMAELVEIEHGMGRFVHEPWWDDEWNWLDGLVHDTRVMVKGTAEDPTPADDTEFCYDYGECVDLHMPINGGTLTTVIAEWIIDGGNSNILVDPSFGFWAEAGPDAWDTVGAYTTRSYADRYHVDYVKILLNNEWIQAADQSNFDFPACTSPLCDWHFFANDILDWRLDLVESLGGEAARENPVVEAAARDHGQTAQSSEATEKYLIYWEDPQDRDCTNWCTEFASWAIREGTDLETPVAPDVGTNLVVGDMWDFFDNAGREIVWAEDVWDSEGSCVQPGDYLSRSNWGHSMIVIGWDGAFDANEDINYLWVTEGNVGWSDQHGGTTAGGGWRPHVRVGYASATRAPIMGPDADWVIDAEPFPANLCKTGYVPGPNPGPSNPDGRECDFFGSTQE